VAFVKGPQRIGELLFGVVALQKGYLSLPQMMNAIADRGEEHLADALVAQGLIDAERRKELDSQVASAIAAAGDEAAALRTLQTDERMLLESLSAVDLDSQEPTVRSAPQMHLGLAPVFPETSGRYEWDEAEELGRGGVGRVVRIWDSSMGRTIALKQLIARAETPKARAALEARFLREARLTGQLDHPAVLPVYEIGRQEDGGLYYAMQRVQGRTLFETVHASTSLRERLALLPHFLTACQAMAYAHARGVVHRDLKPQNIMLGQYGETYVLDWGLARVRGQTDFQARELAMVPDLTGNVLEGRAIGTPSYMSPEQGDGRFADIDEKSDVWGLGAVLFELVAKRPPFTGKNVVDVLVQVRHQAVAPLNVLQPDAPPELCAIAMKCLQRSRDQRYPNASAVAADVEAFLNDRRVSAYSYGSGELIKRFVRQNRRATAVAAIALVVLVAAGGVMLRRIQQERDSAKELAQLFLTDVSLKLEPKASSRALLEELTTQTLQQYERQLDGLGGKLDEQLKLGWAWQRIGRLAYKVGKLEEAERAFAYAGRVADGLLNEAKNDPNLLTLSAEARVGLSDVTQDRGEVKQSEELLAEAERRSAIAAQAQPDSPQTLETLSRVLSRQADLFTSVGRDDEGLKALLRSRELDRRVMALKPDDPQSYFSIAVGAVQLGHIAFSRGDIPGARASFEELQKVCDEGLKHFPGNADLLSDEAYAMSELAFYDRQEGRPQRDLKKAREIVDQILEENPDHIEYLTQAVELAVEQQDLDAAWRLSRQLLELEPSGDYIGSGLVGAFISGHHDAVLKIAPNVKGISALGGALFAAMSAGAVGDWRNAAAMAARARENLVQKYTLSWSWRRMPVALKGLEGPPAQALRELMAAGDDYFVTNKPEPMLAALARYQAFADAQATRR
jgi:tetratricopeptide (TPR) repeat protein